MIKKTISIVLALIMALSLLAITASAAGGDAPSSWAVPEVDKAKDLGLVPPTLQSKYSDATTRAEFCLLAVTLYEKVTGTTITGRVKFTDTTDVNVEKAAFIGVVNGMGNNRFDPNGTLTRQQAATMLARLAESVSKPLNKKAATFVDKGSVSTWAIEAVGQCEAAEIMGGTGNNLFSPSGPYQRQQSIATITRLYDYLDGTGTPNHAMEVTTTTPTPTPEPEPTMPTTTPPYNGNSSIIGSWTWTEEPQSPVDTAGRYLEFKSDGSYYFRYRFSGTWQGSATYVNLEGILTETGKYTVQGDTVSCSNIIRSVEITYGDTGAGFKNKSYSNCDRKFYFEDSPHWLYTELNLIPLRIDMHHPSENPDWVPAEFLSFVNPVILNESSGIIGWPKELPGSIYPTGLTGTVTTNYEQETISERFAAHQYVRFTVNVNSKDRSVLNPYFEQLRQNGFAFPYGTDSVSVKKSMTISGVRYEVTIDRNHLGVNPDEVVLHFVFEQYDSPSWDWEWD